MTETYSIVNVAHFNGTTPNFTQLEQEIANSSIATAVSYSERVGDTVNIIFTSTISGADKTTLDGLVSSHSPITPLGSQIMPINIYSKGETTTEYISMSRFEFPGTDVMSDVTHMKIISYKMSGGTSYDVRIYDCTNHVEIAQTTLTNENESVNDLGTISNLPTNSAIFDVQVKVNGSTGVILKSMNIYYNN